ncbi:hypothetical protein BOTBODRAFT_30376 [Botryobasidium botryosum FD-172 SS1]|uniref:Protein kinase domain-containing protein n=1 Tax=Botryobasidium botryosum (strain FD-172 SS1) TaxID=930990 RepID=A0A067MMK8_BOTB1|nr:hypothetical protein BOTBODRAFT_30376 [Botryobasidium botryosum FD-172 SS1]
MGLGGTASCYEGMFLERHPVVLKRLDRLDARLELRFSREVAVWKQLKHPRILDLIGLHTHGNTKYMVSPLMMYGSAREYLKPHLDSNCTLKVLLQTAQGLEYLHNHEPNVVVHGDLYSKNILVSDSGDIRIADFGLSMIMEEFFPDQYSLSWHNGGNIKWKAPECLRLIDGQPAPRTTMSDIFSFGRVIVELTTLKEPFPDIPDQYEFWDHIKDGNILPPRPTDEETIARGLNDELWRLVEDCCKDAELRPTAAEVVRRLEAMLVSQA